MRIPNQSCLRTVIGLSAAMLAACTASPRLASGVTSASQSPIVVPTSSLPGVNVVAQPLAPSPAPSSVPTAPVSWVTPAPVAVDTQRLDHQVATSLALDSAYIYWTPAPNSGRILRYPIAGGSVETIATSHFNDAGDGYLGSYGLQRTGDWLIFTDTRASNDSVWAVRALNVKTGYERVVMEASPALGPSASPDYMADGDQIALTRTAHPGDGKCDQSFLALVNLRTGEERELDHVCMRDHYVWAFPQLSGDRLIVEQDLPASRGGGSNIFLFDLATGKPTALTVDGQSSMPVVSGKWLIWKAGPRYQTGLWDVIYDLTTGQKQMIAAPNPNLSPSDPQVAGRWLYWLPGGVKPFFVYNLETNEMFEIARPGQNENIETVALSDSYAVWSLNPDFSSSQAGYHVLEWRPLPR